MSKDEGLPTAQDVKGILPRSSVQTSPLTRHLRLIADEIKDDRKAGDIRHAADLIDQARGSAQCEQPNAGKFLSVALQVIHACNGDPKRADEAAHVIAVAACSTPAEGDSAAFTKRLNEASAEIKALEKELSQARDIIDLLERNAGIQAKLLADTARELDFYKQESSERQQQICETNDRLMLALGQVESAQWRPISTAPERIQEYGKMRERNIPRGDVVQLGGSLEDGSLYLFGHHPATHAVEAWIVIPRLTSPLTSTVGQPK